MGGFKLPPGEDVLEVLGGTHRHVLAPSSAVWQAHLKAAMRPTAPPELTPVGAALLSKIASSLTQGKSTPLPLFPSLLIHLKVGSKERTYHASLLLSHIQP